MNASRVSGPAPCARLVALQLAFAPARPGGRRPRHGHRDLPQAPLKVFHRQRRLPAPSGHQQLISPRELTQYPTFAQT